MNEYIIYSKWLAYKLRTDGFKIIRTEINKNFPQYICWVFEDSEEFRTALTNARK